MYLDLLKHKSFMAYWGASTFMDFASNILEFALAIYVLDMTGSALIFSTVLSVVIIPRLICSPLAGYLADFKDCLFLIRWGTFGFVAFMACFSVIHIFVVPLTVPLIYGLVISLEVCETLLSSAGVKAVVSIVESEQIAAASKISSLDDGIIETFAPIISGFVYGFFGLNGTFVVALVIEILAFLLAMMVRHRPGYSFVPDETVGASAFSLRATITAYKESVRCLCDYRYIVKILLFSMLFLFFINPLFSVTAAHHFRITMGASVGMYALFNAMVGVAGLVAPFIAMVVVRNDVGEKEHIGKTIAGTIIASALVLFVLTCVLHTNFVGISPDGMLYVVTGSMMLVSIITTILCVACNIMVKTHIPERIMGRVISIDHIVGIVIISSAQLTYGALADHFPVTVAYLVSAAGLSILFIVMIKMYREQNVPGNINAVEDQE